MSEEQVHEYDEIAIVSMLLSDNERLKKAESFLLPEDFANEGCSVLLRSLYTFEAKYGRLPTAAELRDSLILPRHAPVEEIHRQLAEVESHLKENHDFYWDELKTFVQQRRAQDGLLAAADCVKKGKLEEAQEKVDFGFRPVEPDHVFVTARMADVDPQRVAWLWRNVFPKNKLSLLAGDSNVGKSYFTMMLSAHVSNGRPFPTTEEPVERGRVLLLVAEDGVADTIYWRLAKHAADLTMVEVVTAVVDKNSNRWPDLGQDVGAMYRVSGSMAFVGVARAAWLVARDKEDPKLRHLAPVKCNLTAETTGFSFVRTV